MGLIYPRLGIASLLQRGRRRNVMMRDACKGRGGGEAKGKKWVLYAKGRIPLMDHQSSKH